MWFEESNMYFCHVENFAYGEINERSFSNPRPSLLEIVVELLRYNLNSMEMEISTISRYLGLSQEIIV